MLVQIIGFIGFFLLGISNIKKNRKDIIIFQILSSFFFSVHYFLLKAMTASILNIIGIFRGLTFYNKNRSNKLNYLYLSLYIITYIVIGTITYESIFSIFPVIAYILFSIAVFNDSEVKIKFINIFVSITWLIYDYIYHSYAGIVSDTAMIITIIVGLYVLRRDKSSRLSSKN